MQNFDILHQIFSLDFQESYSSQPSSSQTLVTPPCTLEPETILIEISPSKSLHVSSNLNPSQQEKLVSLLRDHLDAFARSYDNMKGIPLQTCTHHI